MPPEYKGLVVAVSFKKEKCAYRVHINYSNLIWLPIYL